MTRAKADAPVIEVLIQVVAKNGRWGFRLCFDWMRNHCYEWNHKRIWRIYKEMALTLFRETKVIKPALEMLNIIKWPRSSGQGVVKTAQKVICYRSEMKST